MLPAQGKQTWRSLSPLYQVEIACQRGLRADRVKQGQEYRGDGE